MTKSDIIIKNSLRLNFEACMYIQVYDHRTEKTVESYLHKRSNECVFYYDNNFDNFELG